VARSTRLPRLRGIALFLLVASLLAAACSSGDDDDDASDDTNDTADTSDTADTGDSTPDTEASGDDEAVIETATTWIADESGLSEDEQDQLGDPTVTHQGPVSHVTFTQEFDGVPVRGAEYTVHVLDDGTVQSTTDARVDAEPAGSADPEIEEALAVENASKAVTGTVSGDPETTLVWVQDGESLLLAFQVLLSTTDPIGTWQVVIDAASGDTVDVANTLGGARDGRERAAAIAVYRATHGLGTSAVAQQTGGDACELTDAPSACVFVPDPIMASGGDLTDPRDADDYLTAVPLEGLDDPDSGELVGEYVDTISVDPTPDDPDDDAMWGAGRGEDGFAAQMVYYWIDNTQRHLQDLGFTDVLALPFPVNTVAEDPSAIDNAYYDPAAVNIQMGVSSQGLSAAEDASVIVHEYGHAVLDSLAPGILLTVDGSSIHEGFGDLLAFFSTLPVRTDPESIDCISIWYLDTCLRLIDPGTVFPEDLQNEPHADGGIYAGAVYQAFVGLLDNEGLAVDDCVGTDACADILDRMITVALGSAGYLSEESTMPDAAEAILLANEAYYDDADRDVFEAAFAARGLLDGGGATPDGEGIAIGVEIEHTYRGDLSIAAGVVDADLNILCEVNLADPDENDAFDDFSGIIDLTGTECDDPSFLPPSADHQWVLLAIDTLRLDTGQVVDFTVYDGDTPYRAENVPVPIPDNDPEGVYIFVNGGAGTPDDGMGEVPAGDDYASIEISHSYRGDLLVQVGAVDTEGNILCSVDVAQPDSSDSEADIVGDISLEQCAEFLPPSPDTPWFLVAVDSAAVDEGTVEAFSITTADGTTYVASDTPIAIPDDDLDNPAVSLIVDATGSGTGAMPGTATAILDLAITHSYSGDLSIAVVVLDASGEALCVDQVLDPGVGGSTPDVVGQVELPECTAFYPPAPDQQWFLSVIDTAAVDEGTVDSATIIGTDGSSYPAADLPIAVPDNDPDGVVIAFQ
jgi:subtilisin-like proprotein convertase family protein